MSQSVTPYLSSFKMLFCLFEIAGEYKAHVAAKQGNLQLLSMLIKESHCGVNDRDSQGSTPLHKGKN